MINYVLWLSVANESSCSRLDLVHNLTHNRLRRKRRRGRGRNTRLRDGQDGCDPACHGAADQHEHPVPRCMPRQSAGPQSCALEGHMIIWGRQGTCPCWVRDHSERVWSRCFLLRRARPAGHRPELSRARRFVNGLKEARSDGEFARRIGHIATLTHHSFEAPLLGHA